MGLPPEILYNIKEEKRRLLKTKEEIIDFKKEQKEKGFVSEVEPYLIRKDVRFRAEDMMQRFYKEKESEDRFEVVYSPELESFWKEF